MPRRVIRSSWAKPQAGATLNFGWAGPHTDGKPIGSVLTGGWLFNEQGAGFARDLSIHQTALSLVNGGFIAANGLYCNAANEAGAQTTTPPADMQAGAITLIWTGFVTGTPTGNEAGNRGATLAQMSYTTNATNPYVAYGVSFNYSNAGIAGYTDGPGALEITGSGTGGVLPAVFAPFEIAFASSNGQSLYTNGVITAVSSNNGFRYSSPVFSIGSSAGGTTANSKSVCQRCLVFNVVLSPAAVMSWYSNPYPAGMFTPNTRRVYRLPLGKTPIQFFFGRAA